MLSARCRSSSSSAHAGQAARCPATVAASGVSPAVSRSKPPDRRWRSRGSRGPRSTPSSEPLAIGAREWDDPRRVAGQPVVGGDRQRRVGQAVEVGQRLAEPRERPAGPGLDRAERPAEAGRDLASAERLHASRITWRSSSGIAEMAVPIAWRASARSSEATGSRSGSSSRAPRLRGRGRAVRGRRLRARPASPSAATRRGRRLAARSRSTARFRAIAESHVVSEPSRASKCSAQFQRARKTACATSSAACRSAVSR